MFCGTSKDSFKKLQILLGESRFSNSGTINIYTQRAISFKLIGETPKTPRRFRRNLDGGERVTLILIQVE